MNYFEIGIAYKYFVTKEYAQENNMELKETIPYLEKIPYPDMYNIKISDDKIEFILKDEILLKYFSDLVEKFVKKYYNNSFLGENITPIFFKKLQQIKTINQLWKFIKFTQNYKMPNYPNKASEYCPSFHYCDFKNVLYSWCATSKNGFHYETEYINLLCNGKFLMEDYFGFKKRIFSYSFANVFPDNILANALKFFEGF